MLDSERPLISRWESEGEAPKAPPPWPFESPTGLRDWPCWERTREAGGWMEVEKSCLMECRVEEEGGGTVGEQ